MKVIYLSANADVGQVECYQLKNQNKFGTMYGLKSKLELVTSEDITEYSVSKNENGKLSLGVDCPQLQDALNAITQGLNTQNGFKFKPAKERIYLKMSDEQAASLPKNQKLRISVNIYGVFVQASTDLCFLQMELTTFKTYPLINFDGADDNAMFP